jgi:hypothetical protein
MQKEKRGETERITNTQTKIALKIHTLTPTTSTSTSTSTSTTTTTKSNKQSIMSSRPVQRSTILPQTSRKNERGDIRRGGDATRHPELGFKGCRTLYEGFRRGHKLNPLGACLGFRAISTNGLATPYIYSSYTEVSARINAFAAGLDTLNLVPPTTKDDGEMILVGLYMKNCMEWFIAEQAIFCVSGATVPFYDTLGPESVQFILKQTSTKTVVSTRKELQRLCTVKKSGLCPYFEVVVLVDGVTAHAAKIAKEAGLSVMSFAKVEAGTFCCCLVSRCACVVDTIHIYISCTFACCYNHIHIYIYSPYCTLT